jgi:primosomal protein N''
MNTIKKLSDQYDKINTTQNKLDTNLINNRNNKLFKEMDLVTEKLNKLKNVEKEHRKLEGQVSSGEKFQHGE